ncbi:MAG: biotin/lipoyl-binding protein [Bacteroidales bacterium]|nr:biotin/lipoyl-binding protein [Bacteroidales bacterium]
MKIKNFNKILIANRGEIALRIIRATHKAGKTAVAVYAESDRDMPFVKMADEAWSLGEGPIRQTYLNQEKIIGIAKKSKADAIHPGYGFLSENSDFAALCAKHRVTFIGPSPEVIERMGNKANARATAMDSGVPVIEGITGSVEEILAGTGQLQFPLLIKPAAGGGGKGMYIVHEKAQFKDALQDAAREADNYFGSGELYVEQYIEKARHIEVQVIADNHGNAVHLFERECTLQRRHQKIIEEAPATSISAETREKITQSALLLTKNIGYTNAGTVEFLADQDGNFFFIEMNTRIQVEHPATEMITGKDLVYEQIRIAENKKLGFARHDIAISGHAIEARLYAENPEMDFIPVTGEIRKVDTSTVTSRIDGGYDSGNIVTPYYDPMLAKIIVHAPERSEAISRMSSALNNYHISGIRTNKNFLQSIIKSKPFVKNKVHTKFIDENLKHILSDVEKDQAGIDIETILGLLSVVTLTNEYNPGEKRSIWYEMGHWRLLPEIKFIIRGTVYNINYELIERKKEFVLSIEGKQYIAELLQKKGNFFKILLNGHQFNCWGDVNCSEIWLDYGNISVFTRRLDIPDERYAGNADSHEDGSHDHEIIAPLNGKIVKLNVSEGAPVKKGDILLVIESMKMENKITAPRDAEIESVHVEIDDLVESNNILIKLK